jgi:hypothetical protein
MIVRVDTGSTYRLVNVQGTRDHRVARRAAYQLVFGTEEESTSSTIECFTDMPPVFNLTIPVNG